MFLGRLGDSLLGYLLAGKGVIRAGEENDQTMSGFLMSTYPLAYFKIQRFYQK